MSSSFLNGVDVASPCTASWDEMAGDNRVRFCSQCQLNVYNLSEMTGQEAESFLANHFTQNNEARLCVRFYRRSDGTLLTQDCPVGIQIIQRRKLSRKQFSWSKTAAAITLIGILGIYTTTIQAAEPNHQPSQTKPPKSEILGGVQPSPPPLMGKIAPPSQPPSKPDTKPTPNHSQGEIQGQAIMGDIVDPTIQPPCPEPKQK